MAQPGQVDLLLVLDLESGCLVIQMKYNFFNLWNDDTRCSVEGIDGTPYFKGAFYLN